MINPEALLKRPDLFSKVYPHAHPLAKRLWNLRYGYSNDIPEELIPNDPNVPQNEKARKGFWSSLLTAMDCLVDEDVILDPHLRNRTKAFITFYQEHRFKKDKLTKPRDVKLANAFLDMGLKHALLCRQSPN